MFGRLKAHHHERHMRRGPEGHGLGGRRHGRDHDQDGPHSRRKRMFEQGELRFVILKLIADKPAHGYELIKAIEDSFGGAYSPSPGVVYPTLALLEDMGFADVVPGEGSKKLYTITQAGRDHLAENAGPVEGIFARMSESGRHARGRMDPRIKRAIANFRTALDLKLSAAPLTDSQIDAIAEAIDRAAGEIERG